MRDPGACVEGVFDLRADVVFVAVDAVDVYVVSGKSVLVRQQVIELGQAVRKPPAFPIRTAVLVVPVGCSRPGSHAAGNGPQAFPRRGWLREMVADAFGGGALDDAPAV